MTTDTTFWNDRAVEYAAKPVELPDAFERKIDITRRLLTPTSVVLDIGCGTGSLAFRLADAAGSVHGLDFSREMIRIAEEKASEQRVDNVQFHTAPFDEDFTFFADESLDMVCAYSLLHLVEDRPATLRQIHRLLKPGGVMVSSTVCAAEGWMPMRPILTVMQWLGQAPFVDVISKKQLVDDVEAAGFVDLQQPEVGAKAVTAFLVARKR